MSRPPLTAGDASGTIWYSVAAPGRWTEAAACRDEPELADAFTTTEGDGLRSALAVCARCPVRGECGAYGVASGSDGVWGGAVLHRGVERARRLRAS